MNLSRMRKAICLLMVKKGEKMTEVEKMRNCQLADMSVPELQASFKRAKKLLAQMRGLCTYDEEYRE